MSDPPPKQTSAPQANNVTKQYLPKLTDMDKKLLNAHEGCAHCRKFYAGHRSDSCLMKKTNTWPDAASYVPLAEVMAKAAVPRIVVGAANLLLTIQDDDTDSYVTSTNTAFSIPHLYATFSVTGPSIPDFPITVSSLLDIGCPSTVINSSLIDKLGLRRYPLPASEDNLSSLSQQPLRCLEYVKLELTSGNGMWKSGSHRAKVNRDLPVPYILGMPFLAAEHVVIDVNARTAIDKCNGYDLVTPPTPSPREWQPEKVTPPPTPRKIRTPPACVKPAALAGHLCSH
ncbi:hypothetical protein BDQ17DRAFT_1428160 [Cyathus striatus]|nr:hypothetical protein BDQ17DRAFT_1428160 [Cyathus striatus]